MAKSIVVKGQTLYIGDRHFRCATGKGGCSDSKREGDGTTPLGTFTLGECWYRPDKLEKAPDTKLPLKPIGKDDGWCDDPKSLDYNKHVKLPYDASHEKLWRDDDIYDLIVPLSYNSDPVQPGKGSAIFLHVARDDYSPTEGCVALAKEDLLTLLSMVTPETRIEISREINRHTGKIANPVFR